MASTISPEEMSQLLEEINELPDPEDNKDFLADLRFDAVRDAEMIAEFEDPHEEFKPAWVRC